MTLPTSHKNSIWHSMCQKIKIGSISLHFPIYFHLLHILNPSIWIDNFKFSFRHADKPMFCQCLKITFPSIFQQTNKLFCPILFNNFNINLILFVRTKLLFANLAWSCLLLKNHIWKSYSENRDSECVTSNFLWKHLLL